MVWPETLRVDCKRAGVRCLRLVVIPLCLQDIAKIVERQGDIRVILTQRQLPDRDRSLVESLGLIITVLRFRRDAEIMERVSHLGVVLAERRLLYLERPTVEQLRVYIFLFSL